MRKLALATTALPLLLGLAAVAQAGTPPPPPDLGVLCETIESAVLECKGAKKGGFEVFAFSNSGANAVANFSVGDDCTEALDNLANVGDSFGALFFVDEVSTGTPDRTLYTLIADGGECPSD